jgi:hypothetical protein
MMLHRVVNRGRPTKFGDALEQRIREIFLSLGHLTSVSRQRLHDSRSRTSEWN